MQYAQATEAKCALLLPKSLSYECRTKALKHASTTTKNNLAGSTVLVLKFRVTDQAPVAWSTKETSNSKHLDAHFFFMLGLLSKGAWDGFSKVPGFVRPQGDSNPCYMDENHASWTRLDDEAELPTFYTKTRYLSNNFTEKVIPIKNCIF